MATSPYEKWLNSSGNFLFTNKEILEMPLPERLANPFLGDWFNPFDNPEKVDDLRLNLAMKPIEWKEYVITHFPGIDANQEYKKRKNEVKKLRIENCGLTGHWYWSPEAFAKVWQPHFCKLKECPKCAAKLQEAGKERLSSLQGRKLEIVSQEDEQKFKAGLKKDDYVRIPMSDGNVAFVLNEMAGIGERSMTYTDALRLSKEMIAPDNGRVSGNLGKVKKEEEIAQAQTETSEPDFVYDILNASPEDIPNQRDISFRTFQIDFSEGSLTPNELERQVLERVEADEDNQTFDNLQYVVYQLEELTQAVCRENGVKILFLYTGHKTVSYSDIKWDKLNRFKK